MSDKLQSLQNSLVSAQLPVLDATLAHFDSLMNKPTTSNQHLAEIIRSDIGFTLALFRKVNTPSTERDPVQTVEHAISMLGIAKVAETGSQLQSVSSLSATARTELKKLYSRAMHATQYFQALAAQLRLPRIAEISNTVRMMPLAEVALWANNSSDIQSHSGEAKVTLIGEQQLALDQAIRNLGLALAKNWCLPKDLQAALAPDYADNNIALAMTLAERIADETAADWHSATTQQLLQIWAQLVEKPVEQVSNRVHQLAAETARQIQQLQLPQPAYFLFFPRTRKKPANSKQTAPVAEQTAADNSSPSANRLQQVLTVQMQDIQKKTGAQRVLFAILTPDKAQLKVRFVLGGNKQDAIRRFQTDLGQRSLFSLLMEKPQGIHLSKHNQKKYLPLIPATERASLHTDNLYAMSLFVKNKPVGLFIADNAGDTLNAEQYKQFKQLCNNAAKSLESL